MFECRSKLASRALLPVKSEFLMKLRRSTSMVAPPGQEATTIRMQSQKNDLMANVVPEVPRTTAYFPKVGNPEGSRSLLGGPLLGRNQT